MQEYQLVEPGLKICGGLEAVKLAPGVYNLVENGQVQEDDVEEAPMADFFVECFKNEHPEYAGIFSNIDSESFLMLVPDYDYENRKSNQALLDIITYICESLNTCGVNWCHVSQNYEEIREQLSRFHQYSPNDIKRADCFTAFSGYSPTSLIISNQSIEYLF